MLITVKKSKLVLGRTVYHSGDVFECRDAEAKILVAVGMATMSPQTAKATKVAPSAPMTGISNKPGTPKTSAEMPARSVGRAKRIPTLTSPASSVPEPVGAMTMPERPNESTPATTTKA